MIWPLLPRLRVERRACEIRLRAERKAGQLLTERDRTKGVRMSGGSIVQPPENGPPTLADLGITGRQSMDWQRLAAVAEEEFEAALAAPDEKPTTSGMIKAGSPDPTRRRSGAHRTHPSGRVASHVAGFPPSPDRSFFAAKFWRWRRLAYTLRMRPHPAAQLLPRILLAEFFNTGRGRSLIGAPGSSSM